MNVIARTRHDLESVLEVLSTRPIWAVAGEYTSLDPFKGECLRLGLFSEGHKIIIETDLRPLEKFLSDPAAKKIMFDGKTEYKLIKHQYGIEIESIEDIHLAERCVLAGSRPESFNFRWSAEKWADMDVGEHPPLEVRLEALWKMHAYFEDFTKGDPTRRTWLLENSALQAFGDMELDGMLLDKALWSTLIASKRERLDEVSYELERIAGTFFPCDDDGKPLVNFDSPAQMLSLFKRMGIKAPVLKNGAEVWEDLKNTSSKTLKLIQDKYPLVSRIMERRSLATSIRNFGAKYLEAINDETGRVHQTTYQYGTDTGRIRKGVGVNLLNIPKAPEYRRCWVAEPGWKIETHDYRNCELRIWADLSGDPNLLKAFAKDQDIHCMVAEKIFNTKVKRDSPLRIPAKAFNFGIMYGMGPHTLYRKIREEGYPVTFAEVERFFKNYTKNVFPSGVRYLREKGREAATVGYLYSRSGRVRIFPGVHNNRDPAVLNSIEREGGNFVVQSINADIIKLAMKLIRDYRKKHNVRTKILNHVYDEIVTSTHGGDRESFAKAKTKIMEYASDQYLYRVPMTVDCSIGNSWGG